MVNMKRGKHPKNKRRQLQIGLFSIASVAILIGGYWFIRHNLIHAQDAQYDTGPTSDLLQNAAGPLPTAVPSNSLDVAVQYMANNPDDTDAPNWDLYIKQMSSQTTPIPTEEVASDGTDYTTSTSNGITTNKWSDGTVLALDSNNDGEAAIPDGSGGTILQEIKNGVVVSQTNPDGSISKFGENTTTTTMPNGSWITVDATGLGGAAIIDSSGTTYQTIKNNVVISQTNPDGSTQDYDETGTYVKSLTLANGNKETYSSNGNLLTSYDKASGKTTTYDPSTGKQTGTTDSSGKSTTPPSTAPQSGSGAATPGSGPASPTVTKTTPKATGKASTPTKGGTKVGGNGVGISPQVITPVAATSIIGTFFNTSGTKSISSFVSNLYDWALVIGAGLAVIVIMYAGYTYITSAGDPEAVRSAKDYLVGALIGLTLLIMTATVFRFLAVASNKVGTNSATASTPTATKTP